MPGNISGFWRRPRHGIHEDLPYFWPIIVVVGLVPRREVEHPAFANRPAHSHASRFGLAIGFGVHAIERHRFGRRDSKWFAIPLDLRQLKIFHSFANGMVRFFDDNFGGGAVSNIFAPTAS